MVGDMYLSANGVPYDAMQAYIWFYVSEAHGNADAANELARLKRLTLVQKIKATMQARALSASIPGDASAPWGVLSILAAGLAIAGWFYWRRAQRVAHC